MEYSNQLVTVQTAVPVAVEAAENFCPHCQQPLPASVPPPRKPKKKHLWVDALNLLEKTHALALAQQAVQWANRNQLERKGKPGPKPTYADATILLTFLVAKLWHLSYEEMLAWLLNWPQLARALGYPLHPKSGELQIISLGNYSKRVQALGVGVFFAFFLLVVRQLLAAGVMKGGDVIIDSTILRGWSWQDAYCAVSYKYKDVNKRFGVKVHTVIDRVSGLPLMFAVSPANAHDGPYALPLLRAAVDWFGLSLQIVRADAAYHCQELRQWVVEEMGAVWAVDYNVRRKGKKQLADRSQMKRWKWLMRPRATIERFFAWAKRHYRMKYFKVQGEAAINRHVIATYIAMLLVGWVAFMYGRADLMRRANMKGSHEHL